MADPHVGFIVAAYVVTGVVLAAMIGSVVLDYRRLSAELERATRAVSDARPPGEDRPT